MTYSHFTILIASFSPTPTPRVLDAMVVIGAYEMTRNLLRVLEFFF
jgi:hypothetical protein